MSVTAEQAAALLGPFVVDGDPTMTTDEFIEFGTVAPPKVWADLDRPCDECRGSGWVMPDYKKLDCFTCHGTGRHVEELREPCQNTPFVCTIDHSLGLFTIQVVPAPFTTTDAGPGQYVVIPTQINERK